jgi:hypothetical protein
MSVTNPTLIDIQDEGVSQGQVTRLNFTGAGVAASVSGFTGTVNVTSGGAGVAKESHIPLMTLALEVAF